jgi:hypothetical protein
MTAFLRDFAENTATSGAGLAMSGKTAIILLIANEIRGLAVVLAFWGVI